MLKWSHIWRRRWSLWWCLSFLRRVVKFTGYWQPLIHRTVLWNPLQMMRDVRVIHEKVLTIWKALIDTWGMRDYSLGWRYFFDYIGSTDEVYILVHCLLCSSLLPPNIVLLDFKKRDNSLLSESLLHDPLLLTPECVAECGTQSSHKFPAYTCLRSTDSDKVPRSPLKLMQFLSFWFMVVLLLARFSCSWSYSATTLTIIKAS